jgi:hypothetical protein
MAGTLTARTREGVRRAGIGLRRLLPVLGQTLLLALVCNLSLELARLAGAEGHPWQAKTPAFAWLFLLGTVVVWLLVVLVHCVVGRMRVTAPLMLAVTAVIAAVDYEKVRLRREPLYPSDLEFLGELGFMADMIEPQGLLVFTLLVAAMVAASLGMSRLLRRRRLRRERRRLDRGVTTPAPTPVRRRTRVVTRLAVGGLAVLALAHLGQFNTPGNAGREAYESAGATWMPFSQQRNYLGNGFVAGVLYNLDVPPVMPPPGYSEELMNRVAQRYVEAARQINRERRADALADTNVVMVLSESFTDPLALDGITVRRDPIPYIRRLMATETSGSMLAENIGGGTANMEFETLTSMSMSGFPPQLRVPYQMVVPNYPTFPSVVQVMERTGHRTVAIHPFTTEMYRRSEVYRVLGFDAFVHDADLPYARRIGNDAFISDAAAFDEVQRRLARSERPVFANIVTMQNHRPYLGRYDDPVSVTGDDGTPLPEVGQYVRGLTHTDRAVRELVAGLERLDEPTVVLFYGDHLPGIYPAEVFEANDRQRMHTTPYFVWSNVGRPVQGPPVTSPTHFTDLVLERAGAEVVPYYALTERLREALPAFERGMMVDAESRPVRQEDLTPRQAALLRDYRLVQYDLAVGRRHSEAAMFDLALRG